MYGIITYLSARYGEEPSQAYTVSGHHENSISMPTITVRYIENLITVTKN